MSDTHAGAWLENETGGLASTGRAPEPPRAPENNADAVIDVRALSHAFRNIQALDGVTFKVHRQSLHGFVGPNGAGKTTTLKVLCTLLRPQRGICRVFGHDVLHHPREVRQKLGFMPDHFSMYRAMTVYEYLDFFGAAYGLTQRRRDQVIDETLALTDMNERRDDLISGLSRGMQQRVSLARVLINDPELLLLDEPASGLDPRARIELMEILRELQRMGKTIFISSHILSELAELCDSVTIIDRGRVKYSGTMNELGKGERVHPGFTLTVGVDLPDIEQRLQELPGVLEVTRQGSTKTYLIVMDDFAAPDPNRVLRHVLDLGLPVVAFRESLRHLNQAFLDLTEQGVS